MDHGLHSSYNMKSIFSALLAATFISCSPNWKAPDIKLEDIEETNLTALFYENSLSIGYKQNENQPGETFEYILTLGAPEKGEYTYEVYNSILIIYQNETDWTLKVYLDDEGNIRSNQAFK